MYGKNFMKNNKIILRQNFFQSGAKNQNLNFLSSVLLRGWAFFRLSYLRKNTFILVGAISYTVRMSWRTIKLYFGRKKKQSGAKNQNLNILVLSVLLTGWEFFRLSYLHKNMFILEGAISCTVRILWKTIKLYYGKKIFNLVPKTKI